MKNQGKTAFPADLQGVLWSKDIRNIDLARDRAYVINQVLAYGTLDHIRWLFRTYPRSVIRKTFTEQPAKIYSPAGFNFVKTILLTSKRRLPLQRYVSSLPRNAR